MEAARAAHTTWLRIAYSKFDYVKPSFPGGKNLWADIILCVAKLRILLAEPCKGHAQAYGRRQSAAKLLGTFWYFKQIFLVLYSWYFIRLIQIFDLKRAVCAARDKSCA